MNKEIYKAAFDVMKAQNEICNKFESIGININYGDGIGKPLEELLNRAYTIIHEVMGFKFKTHTRTIYLSGYPQNISFDVLYIGEYDESWTITEDDFSDFIYQAVDNEELQELFWKAMVNRNEAAKERFNKIAKDCEIGRDLKD